MQTRWLPACMLLSVKLTMQVCMSPQEGGLFLYMSSFLPVGLVEAPVTPLARTYTYPYPFNYFHTRVTYLISDVKLANFGNNRQSCITFFKNNYARDAGYCYLLKIHPSLTYISYLASADFLDLNEWHKNAKTQLWTQFVFFKSELAFLGTFAAYYLLLTARRVVGQD